MKNNIYILVSKGGKKPLNARSSFTSQKGKVSPGIDLNTWKYNVWGIKLETKVMRLHKIQVEKISSLQISMLSRTFENYL